MAKRVKKIIITGVTREAADEAFAKYANLNFRLICSDNASCKANYL